eukprot:jgi/Mesen1/10348/ME000008S10123
MASQGMFTPKSKQLESSHWSTGPKGRAQGTAGAAGQIAAPASQQKRAAREERVLQTLYHGVNDVHVSNPSRRFFDAHDEPQAPVTPGHVATGEAASRARQVAVTPQSTPKGGKRQSPFSRLKAMLTGGGASKTPGKHNIGVPE